MATVGRNKAKPHCADAPVQRRNALRLLRPTVVALLVAAGTLALIWHRMEPLPLARAEALSVSVLDRNDRLLRAYTTSDGRWRLPDRAQGGRPTLPRHAAGLRGPAFPQPSRRRPRRHRPRRLAARPPSPHRLRRLDADHAGGAPAGRRARAHRHRQGAPGTARAAARAQALQGRDPAALPAACPLRRQPRGRARRLARLLRQGAAAPVAGRGGPARRLAAVA